MIQRLVFLLLATVFTRQIASCQNAIPNTLTPQEAAQGWILLWDGENLFGWEQHGDARWRIEGGALVGDSPEGGWLGTTTAFADFVLQLEFRIAADGNSGVFVRSAREGSPFETGYEVQIYDFHPAGYNTGSIVNHARASTTKIAAGQWNTLEITVSGSHFGVAHNGRKILDAADTLHSYGVLGLQYNRGNKVEFRNIKLRPLNLRPIFDGKDLSGWAKVERLNARSPAEWSVRDGAIHVEKGPGELETDLLWEDFVLQLEVRCNSDSPFHHPGGGVFFRAEKGRFGSGYEDQIRNEYREGNRAAPVDFGTGGLHRLEAARRVVSNDNEFFTNTIIAQGRQISIWVDGYQVSDYYDRREEGADPLRHSRLVSGPIGLQVRDPGASLDFRNLRIAPLPKH